MIEPVKSLSTTLQEESTRIDMDRQDRQQDGMISDSEETSSNVPLSGRSVS